jgi:hypothetical protein
MSFDYTIAASGGTGYAVLPDMQITRTTTFGGGLATNGNINTIDGGTTATGVSILSFFNLVGGVPTIENTQLAYRTGRTFTAPVAVITSVPVITPVATVNVSSAAATLGQVSGLSLVTPSTIPGVNTINGRGYAGPFSVTIEPSIATAPGTGAAVTLSGFAAPNANLEVQWNGTSAVAAPGSGYLPNLNRVPNLAGGVISFSPTGAITQQVVSGGAYKLDIRYGTGNRTQNVD